MPRGLLVDTAIFVACSIAVMVVCVAVSWTAGWSLAGLGSLLVVLISAALGAVLGELVKDVRRALPTTLDDGDDAP